MKLAASLLFAATHTALVAGQLTGNIGPQAGGVPPPEYQFFETGLLQAASLTAGCTGATCGGKIMVNNQIIIVPANLMVFFPAYNLLWGEVFAANPAANKAETGLALGDTSRTNGQTYTVNVAGNYVRPTGTSTTWEPRAAMIEITQVGLMSGSGYIKSIAANGQITVEANPTGAIGAIATPPAAVVLQINDPTGVFAPAPTAGTADGRFRIDPANPTIRAATGYPMCVTAGTAATTCPPANRPTTGFLNGENEYEFTIGTVPGTTLANRAPLRAGDFVTYAGVLGTTINPAAGAAMTPPTVINVFEIVADVAIYTPPNNAIAYVVIEGAKIGTGSLGTGTGGTATTVAEVQDRAVIEGATTDPSRPIHIFAKDYSTAGAVVLRDYGWVWADPGINAQGTVKGRWRLKPTCGIAPLGATATTFTQGSQPAFDATRQRRYWRDCVGPNTVGRSYVGKPIAGGANYQQGTPREIMAYIAPCSAAPVQVTRGTAQTVACPLANINTAAPAVAATARTYTSPTIEYIFPENRPGTPPVASNFNGLPFLYFGGYPSATGVVSARLNPFPNQDPPVAPLARKLQDRSKRVRGKADDEADAEAGQA